MKKQKKRIFNVNKLFDWWSVPHFMFGVVTCLAAVSFSWDVFYTFVGTLFFALFWEFLEKYIRLSEAPGNGWVDVVLALIGFAITLQFVNQMVLNHERYLGLFTIATLLYLFINMIAWRARLEKDHDFLG